MRESEQRLREADRRKDEFLATRAHEVRNPLAPIRNSLHLLRHRAAPGDGPDPVLDMMERQVNQMVRLVDDLLEVSRITRGKIELSLERVELSSILRSAVETSRPLLETSKHQLVLSLPDEPLWVEADSVRLCQVFANLLNNAAKYTDTGGQIAVTSERRGDSVVVTVRDNGVGIPENMLARVFDMFTQIDRTLGRAQGGLGIGLTLVKRLVEMHRGSIEARSAGLGSGCEFQVTLPLEHSPAAAPALAPENPRAPAAEAWFPGWRILVVDDNQDAADSLGMLLRIHGSDVQIVHDGARALEILPGFRPSIVLLDIGMPGMDGYEVARRIRSEQTWDGVVLIALTGWGQPEDRKRTKECGFHHHLVKPVGIEELGSLLRLLDTRSA
jgi:CheY-like chemotaxis protein